jgi:hypothetical protein
MRLAGLSAVSGVRMSFSRRIGALPSMKRRVRWSALVTTQLPMISFSPGFSSTFKDMGVTRDVIPERENSAIPTTPKTLSA